MSGALPSGLLRCRMNPRVRSARFISERTAAMSRAPKECSPAPACRKWKPIVTQNEPPKMEAASSAAPRHGSNKLFGALKTKRETCSKECVAPSRISLIGTDLDLQIEKD